MTQVKCERGCNRYMTRGYIFAVNLNFDKWPTYGLLVQPQDGGRGDWGGGGFEFWEATDVDYREIGWQSRAREYSREIARVVVIDLGREFEFSKVTDFVREASTCFWVHPLDEARART